MKFWDSSALVPLFVEQAATTAMADLFRQDPTVVAWWGSRVECDSAVARLERGGSLDAASAVEAFKRLSALAGFWQEVQPLETIRESARRFLRVYDLRAGDALQLAAAVLASEGRPSTLEFVCLDGRLGGAADREGFPIVGN